MTEEMTLDHLIEVVKLRVKRRELLLEDCPTYEEMRKNLKKRMLVRDKLYSLTKNPIYIHF